MISERAAGEPIRRRTYRAAQSRRPRNASIWVAIAAGTVHLLPIGCVPIVPPEVAGVVVVDAELGEPPLVGPPIAFKWAPAIPIDPINPEAGVARRLSVTVDTASPDSLGFRLFDIRTGKAASLIRLSSAPGIGRPSGEVDQRASHALSSGRGVFWRSASQGRMTGHLFELLLPDAPIGPFSRLVVDTADREGVEWDVATFEMVKDFVYMAVLGDSILWGTGLEESTKIHRRVADLIERRTNRKVIIQRFAQTAATIGRVRGAAVCGNGCNPEAPNVHTPILTQADLIGRGDLLEFVLLDGCINDVIPLRILSPLVPLDTVGELIEEACADRMSQLIEKVILRAPNARIVVTGYYPIISEQSDLFGFQATLIEHGIAENGTARFVLDALAVATLNEFLAQRSRFFYNQSTRALRSAVDAANAQLAGGTRAGFADPGFGGENSLFAPKSWLWGFIPEDDGPGFTLVAEDPIRASRLPSCFDPDVVGGFVQCLYQSVGHPNPAGTAAYARAIADTLEELGVLP